MICHNDFFSHSFRGHHLNNTAITKKIMADENQFESDGESENKNSVHFSQSSFSNVAISTYRSVQIEKIVGYRQNSEIIHCNTDDQMYCFNTKSVLGKSYLCSYIVNKKRVCKSRIY